MYAHLINMGFDETLSMDATHKYGDNIQQCIDYITHNQFNQSIPKSTSTYKDRIDTVLRLNDKMDSEKTVQC